MRFIIDRKTLISMLFIGLTLLGYVSYKQLDVELLPNVNLPEFEVVISASQESEPNYFENEAVIAVEGAISTLGGIESLESTINSRRATIKVYFQQNVDYNLMYLKLQEKVLQVQSTLDDDFTVTVGKGQTSQLLMSNILMRVQARGEGNVDRVRNVVDEQVVDELSNIDGISSVEVYGGQEKTLEINLNEEACKAYGVTASSIRALLSQNSQERMYVGNLIDAGTLCFAHVVSSFEKVQDIENIVVAEGPVLLKDIAEVRFGEKELETYSRINGLEAVNILLIGDTQVNDIELSHATLEVIDKLNKKLLAHDVQLVVQENLATDMEENINQIINLALIGGLMAIFVLWVFLRNLRIVAFIALAMPISIYTAFNVFYAYGISINTLTLIGMALEIGMLLDNSVVVLENIYRLASKKTSTDQAVMQGTSEVIRSIIAATLTTIAVFLPFMFASNYQIKILGENVGISIISTLLISLSVALLFVPMVTHFVLNRKWGRVINFSQLTTDNRLMQIYLLLLKASMRKPLLTIVGAIVVFFLSAIGATLVDSGSLGEVENKQVQLYLTMSSGTSLEKTDEVVRLIEEKLAEYVSEAPNENKGATKKTAGKARKQKNDSLEIVDTPNKNDSIPKGRRGKKSKTSEQLPETMSAKDFVRLDSTLADGVKGRKEKLEDKESGVIDIKEGENRVISEIKDIITNVQEEGATITILLHDDYEKISGREYAEIKKEIYDKARTVKQGSISTSSNSSSGGANAAENFQRILGVGTNRETIVIKGEDYERMENVANDLEYILEDLDIIEWVRKSNTGSQPEVHMRFDQLLMTANEINLRNVANELASFSNEMATGIMFEQENSDYEIVIKQSESKQEKATRTMDDLKQLRINSENGGIHNIEEFTNVYYSKGISRINRVDQEKQITINYGFTQEANESNSIKESYTQKVQNILSSYKYPSGITAKVKEADDELEEIYFFTIIAIILIFMILASVFESIATSFVMLFSIPLAAIGSLIAMMITGNGIQNVNAMIGFLILIGIVVNNGIIFIDYTNLLRKRGFTRSRALIVSGLSRVRPILITAITTIVAMFPLAMGQNEYVGAIGAPFAIVVIGGLIFSTLLTLIFIPTFYSGLENALAWFNKLNINLRIAQLALIILSFVATYLYVDSFLARFACVILGVILVPGIFWFAMNSLKKANAKLISEDEEIHISIQNLVKIYDRPKRFSREWISGLKIRERAGLQKSFTSLKQFGHLIWQLPLLVFYFYFVFIYLKPGFWAYMLMLGFYLFVREFSRPFELYWNSKAERKSSRVYRFLSKFISKFNYYFLPLVLWIIILSRGASVGAFIGLGGLWYLGILIATTSNRLYQQNINIDRITGRFGALKRSFYRTVKKIPIIGKKKKPFRALNGVSLNIETGMFGLLGPNGAGKSTMMRIICGIFEQSYGKIFINGIDTQEKREELQGLIGYLPQEFGTYEYMSSSDYLNYLALLKGIKNPKERKERIEYVLKAVHMWDKKDSKIGSFSGGMKQRIGIAQILLHLPRILVVDEPTAGLDPRERIRFRNLLVELSRERIVIFSTHIIEDIASSCNQVGVVIKGKVKYNGTPNDMVHLANGLVWQYDLSHEEFEALPDKKMVLHHMIVGTKVRLRYLAKEQPHPSAISVTPVLEDAYLCLIKDIK